MAALIFLFLNLAASLFKPRWRLEAENAALRQQLIVLQRKVRGRVEFTNSDRLSSFSCIVGFHQSSRPSRPFGPRPSCAGTMLVFAVIGVGNLETWEAGRRSR
jgi:hypothetical protein